MSPTTIFAPENRLQQILTNAEAPDAESLIRAAEDNVSGVRDSLRDFVLAAAQRVLSFAEMPEEIVFAECLTLGQEAQSICDVASFAGMEAIGLIAKGIVDMIDGLVTAGVWHTDGLKLHLDALALLSHDPNSPPAVVDPILKNLKDMRLRIGLRQ